MRSQILVVEDERNVGATLLERLEGAGLSSVWARSLEEAKSSVKNMKFDAIILDVGLPDGSGFELAEKWDSPFERPPILFLTAFGAYESRIRGLKLGADDYIVKPFHFQELLLRLRRTLGRAHAVSHRSIALEDQQIGEAMVRFGRFAAERGEHHYQLSVKECDLLKLLVHRKNEVVSRDEILDKVWSDLEFPTPRTVDNFILRLRRVVEKNADHPTVITSVRGVGYRLNG